MIGFLLFGASAVVFTLIFVTDANSGITSKEKNAIITRAILCLVIVVIALFLAICFLPDSVTAWLK
jgi:hypothetical protein